MSTRSQILDALSESPDGLTLKELTEFCSDCDHDEQIVGNMIAILQRENVIHAAPELRDGLTVWLEGKEPQEAHEPPISLAGADQRPSSTPSAAARAIADMRQAPKAVAKPATVTPGKPVPTKPASEGVALTLRVKIERALRDHGPMRATDIEKYVQEKYVSAECSKLLNRKHLVKLGGNKRGTVYGLPGQTLKDQQILKNQLPKAREPDPVSKSAAAASPVPAVTAAPNPPAPTDHHDVHPDLDLHAEARAGAAPKGNGENLYHAALLDLQDRRRATLETVLAGQAQLEKIDRAIDAMRALT